MQSIITIITLIVLTAVGFVALTPGVRDAVSAFVEIVSGLLSILLALLGTNSVADWLRNGTPVEGRPSSTRSERSPARRDVGSNPLVATEARSRSQNAAMLLSFLAGFAATVSYYGLAPTNESAVVRVFRDTAEGIVDTWVSPSVSPISIKLVTLFVLFAGTYLLVRVLVALAFLAIGRGAGILLKSVAAPMLLGFLAAAATWTIHYTIAEAYGSTWGAVLLSLCAAIIALFALGRIREAA